MINKEKLREFLDKENKKFCDIMIKNCSYGQFCYEQGYADATAEVIIKLDSGEFDVREKEDIKAVCVKNIETTLNKLSENCIFLSTGISKYRAQTKLPDECMAAEKYMEMFEEAVSVYVLIEQLRLENKKAFDSYYKRELGRQKWLESEVKQ